MTQLRGREGIRDVVDMMSKVSQDGVVEGSSVKNEARAPGLVRGPTLGSAFG